jgi:hypothetical protein
MSKFITTDNIITKDTFDVNTKELDKTVTVTGADLTGGTANAVNTINELKTLLLTLINKGKQS